MTKTKPEAQIQVIDRAASLLDAIARYSNPVKLKILSADTGLHPSTAHRILHSLVSNQFVERVGGGEYQLGRRMLHSKNRVYSDIDLSAVAMPYMERLRDKIGETVNLTIREGDVVIYFEKVTPNRMMHVQQVIGSRAPLHVTAVGKMMLGAGGIEDIQAYAQRTNLPAYTSNTYSSLSVLESQCLTAIEQGFGLDNEEAEIGVGCIGVLLYDLNHNISAGLSISAPMERRRDEWIDELMAVGKLISQQLGYVC